MLNNNISGLKSKPHTSDISINGYYDMDSKSFEWSTIEIL